MSEQGIANISAILGVRSIALYHCLLLAEAKGTIAQQKISTAIAIF